MSSEAPTLADVVDWLLDGAPGAGSAADIIGMAGPRLVAAGLPLVRVAAFVRTLHPQFMGRRVVWLRGTPGVEISDAPYAVLTQDHYIGSPTERVFATGQELRCRLDGTEPLEMDDMREFAARGYTDYVMLPLHFLDGNVHGVAFMTDHMGGFSEQDLADLRKVARALTRITEVLELRRTAVNLLSAYVGRGAGERILQGKVQRGDTERIRAVVWCSDMRGFSALSERLPPEDVILVLNRVFDCMVPAVEAAGGEVLKFLGDGMLAIFPFETEAEAGPAARRAVGAAQAAFAALDDWNAQARPEDALAFGAALHVGEVAFGNIGGLARIDFTCIGPAVNLAVRLEGLTSRLGRRLLFSEAISSLLGEETRFIGSYSLRGMSEPARVYEPEG